MKKSNSVDFINKSNTIHNNVYDYSLIDYKNSRTKVDIICSKHGVFKQKDYSKAPYLYVSNLY